MADTPLKPDSLEQFARLLALGVEAGEAYRKSGVGAALACTVRDAERKPEIQARVAALKASGEAMVGADMPIEVSKLSEPTVLEMLLRDRELARSTGQASAAVRASELIGKQKGMFVERKDVNLNVNTMLAVRLDEAIRRVDAAPVLELTAIESRD